MLRGKRKPSAAKRRAKAATLQEAMEAMENTIVLETAAELALAAFLEPFQLQRLPDVVVKLTQAGYTSANSLLSLDDNAVADAGLVDTDYRADAEKLLLATFLHSVEMVQYGETLVASGCDSVLKLLALPDAGLVRGGIIKLGHRRQLQRYLREDERVQAKAARVAEEEYEREQERRGAMMGGSRSGVKKTMGSSSQKAKGTDSGQVAPIRFEPLAAPTEEPWARHASEDPGGVAMLPTGSSGSIHAWSQPWATTFNAALLGTAPGLRAEAHVDARTPRDDNYILDGGVTLMSNDGRFMGRIW